MCERVWETFLRGKCVFRIRVYLSGMEGMRAWMYLGCVWGNINGRHVLELDISEWDVCVLMEMYLEGSELYLVDVCVCISGPFGMNLDSVYKF